MQCKGTFGLATALLAVGTLVGGCSGGPDDTGDASATSGSGTAAAPSSAPSSVTMIQPGRPGEDASTVGPEAIPSSGGFEHADVAFTQMMVPHHAQALEMAELAQRHAQDPAVRAVARRIEGAQGPEVLALASWLQEHGIDVPKTTDDPSAYDHGDHGHNEMAGMLTEEELDRLAATRGRAFDVLFLQDMIRHHEGAVQMAQDVAVDGSDVRVAEMAADVVAGQSAEITRMQEILDRLQG